MERPDDRPPEDQPNQGAPGVDVDDGPEAELDLLTIGLAVFFVSLIVIVAALLILPAIF